MLNNKFEALIIKYFAKSASIDEMIELTEWLNDESNCAVFKDFVEVNYLIDNNMIDFDTKGEQERILRKIKRDQKSLRLNKFKEVFKYAAILILALGGTYAYLTDGFSSFKTEETITTVSSEIQPGTEKAILTTETGSEIVLENNVKIKLAGRSLKNKKLIYHSKVTSKPNNVEYNYLTIPRGGVFFVQLSDGTNVWLNSESKLKYPVNFVKGQDRVVELVYGEAYFDVSKSTNHYGAPFKVKTRTQEIEVLGTEFNVKAYQDEEDITTTLVEGEVLVGNGIESKNLNPSYQTVMNIKSQKFVVNKVNKVFDEVAWKSGYFSFKQKTMKDIMKTLSRWYDVEYAFDSAEIENKSFTGVLDRESTIDQILIYIQKTNEIDYEINKKTVIIK